MFDNRELATVLAALRELQIVLGEQHGVPDDLQDHFAEHTCLSENEFDALCERLNAPEVPSRYVLYDFDADELATTGIYGSYSDAVQDAAELANVVIVKWPEDVVPRIPA